jgi:predicted nucleic acid-binding protein
VIAVDTNLLVHAHRKDSPWREPAAARLRGLAEQAPWAIPWPCLHEFLAIVTHPRLYAPPTPVPIALDQVSAWLESPSLMLLGVAALCRHHGVRELWSADRDCSRFPQVTVRNPLVA